MPNFSPDYDSYISELSNVVSYVSEFFQEAGVEYCSLIFTGHPLKENLDIIFIGINPSLSAAYNKGQFKNYVFKSRSNYRFIT